MTAGYIERQGLGVERLVDAPPFDRNWQLAIILLRETVPQPTSPAWIVTEFFTAGD